MEAMPWAETSAVQERIRFVKDYQSGLYPMTELCARFGVSRQTGYKWLSRRPRRVRSSRCVSDIRPGELGSCSRGWPIDVPSSSFRLPAALERCWPARA